MSYTFHEEENTVEKCNWCREYIGPDNEGWEWILSRDGLETPGGIYYPTNVCIIIDDEIDATAYKLRWI